MFDSGIPISTPDPATRLSDGKLENEIAELAAHLSAAMAKWLGLVAEFDRRSAHEKQGFATCSSWLAWRCGVTPRSAREHVRVARRLMDLPLTRRAFSRGEISYSKVRALSRIERIEREEDMLELALQSTASQLERIVRCYRGFLDLEDANRAHERRHLVYSHEPDGSLTIRARLDPEAGARFLAALDASRDAVRAGANGEVGSAEPLGRNGKRVCNADALSALAEAGFEALTESPADLERNQVVVRVDPDVLLGDDSGHCEVDNGRYWRRRRRDAWPATHPSTSAASRALSQLQ